MSTEGMVLVVYDIEKDAVRNKISEICLDYGLDRIQYSAFLGPLDGNKRDELFFKLKWILGDKAGRVLMIPICAKDFDRRKEKANEFDGMPQKDDRGSIIL